MHEVTTVCFLNPAFRDELRLVVRHGAQRHKPRNSEILYPKTSIFASPPHFSDKIQNFALSLAQIVFPRKKVLTSPR